MSFNKKLKIINDGNVISAMSFNKELKMNLL